MEEESERRKKDIPSRKVACSGGRAALNSVTYLAISTWFRNGGL